MLAFNLEVFKYLVSVVNKKFIQSLYQLPFFELIGKAHTFHQSYFDRREIELCALLSIKTGACPEDCRYCPQSGHYNTGLKKEPLMDLDAIIAHAKEAKKLGAKRFCMGAAWRTPPKKDWPVIKKTIAAVKGLGLETCMTLGMITQQQANELKIAGLDYYNHNLDTSPEYYRYIISTRKYDDRLKTIKHVINAGINVCCGGILGLGESRNDRVSFLYELTQLDSPPKSIPINKLITIKGTPLENQKAIDSFEFVRTIAVCRILFPRSKIRLSAGRETMNEEMQAWCYMAGANSIFIGDKLLTAKNPSENQDYALLKKLNLNAEKLPEHDEC